MKLYDVFGYVNGVFQARESLYYKECLEIIEELKPRFDERKRKLEYMNTRYLNAFVKEVSNSTVLTEKEKLDLLDRFSRGCVGCLRTSTFNIILLSQNEVIPTEVKVADYTSLIRFGYVYREEEKIVFKVGNFDIERTVSTLRLSPYGIKKKELLLSQANFIADRQLKTLQRIGKI